MNGSSRFDEKRQMIFVKAEKDGVSMEKGISLSTITEILIKGGHLDDLFAKVDSVPKIINPKPKVKITEAKIKVHAKPKVTTTESLPHEKVITDIPKGDYNKSE